MSDRIDGPPREIIARLAPVAVPPRPNLQARACARLGADPDRYERLVRLLGGSSETAWALVPTDAADHRPVAARWLSFVDRAIVDAWINLSDRAPLALGTHDAEALVERGIGFGAIEFQNGRGGLRLSDDRSSWLQITLPGAGRWVLKASLRGRMQQSQVLTQLIDVEKSIEGGTVRQSGIPVAIEFPAIGGLTWLEGSVLESLSVAPAGESDAALGRTSTLAFGGRGHLQLRFWSEAESTLFWAAASLGLDPLQVQHMLERLERRTSDAILDAFDQISRQNIATARNLIAYIDFLVLMQMLGQARSPATASIDLAGGFAGAGWTPVTRIENAFVRAIAPASTGIVLMDVAGAGTHCLKIEGPEQSGFAIGESLSVAVNGVALPLTPEFGDAAGWGLQGFFQSESSGTVLVTVKSTGDRVAWMRALTIGTGTETTGVVKIAFDPHWRSLSAHLAFPDAHAVATFPPSLKIGVAERTLLAFDRDPLPYLDHAARLEGAVREVLDAAPREGTVTRQAQAWLDLLDETIVQAVADGQNIAAVARPLLLGWGRLIDTPNGSARTLGGAGEALILVPPVANAAAIELRFAPGCAVQDLNQLTVTINGRAPKRKTLFFSEELPRLRLDVGEDARLFGQGWIAVRLAVPTVAEGKNSTLFRTLPLPIGSNDAIALLDLSWVASDQPVPALVAPATLPSRTASRIRSKSIATPNSVRCVVPVWGDLYVTTFLEAALPSHLATGNLRAFGDIPTIYQIFTDVAGRARIEHHDLFARLTETVSEVQFCDIEIYRRDAAKAVNQLSASYYIMNQVHHAAIDAAAASGAALLFLNCDTVYSAEVFTRVMALHRQGYRSIENLSIRTDRDRMLAALADRKDPSGALSLESDALTEIALCNLHWIAKGRFWYGGPSLTIPDNLYWQVGDKALIARATHFMPLYMFPRNREIRYDGTIDHGLASASGVSPDEMWRFESPDEPSSWELSLSTHDQAFLPYERGSVREFSRFVAQQCEAVHLQNLQRPVRIGVGKVPAADWQAAIDDSQAIMARVFTELQHLVLTPWRDFRRQRADGVRAAGPTDSGRKAP